MQSYWQMPNDVPEEEDDDDDEDAIGMALHSWRRCRTYVLGLDLGRMQDYTALAVVHRPRGRDGIVQVPYLQRFPLRTSYPDIVTRVTALLATPPLREQVSLVIDATGVGAPVVDLFVKARLHPVAVLISGGEKVHRDRKTRYSVPERELVASVQVLLQEGRLKIASALPEAEVLVQELLNFQVKITASAHDTYGVWREGQHDDLVLALALAVWYGTQG